MYLKEYLNALEAEKDLNSELAGEIHRLIKQYDRDNKFKLWNYLYLCMGLLEKIHSIEPEAPMLSWVWAPLV